MSLLRDVLKRNQQTSGSASGSALSASTLLPRSSKRSVKSYASSIKSAGGATIRSLAESMLSFYSMVTLGGTRVPKRRRPDFSRLGVPEWYAEDPPPAPLMPGTDVASPVPSVFTRGIAGVLHARNEGEKPWLGLVVYSHARPESVMPMYHNAGKFSCTTSFLRIRSSNIPGDMKRRNLARVPLPPSYHIAKVCGFSGNIKYTIGVNIVFDGFGGIDDEFDMEMQYLPLCKPLPRVKTPFPYIPTREDWPFNREVVGGWTLTPFGGRGRLGEEMVEIEGILGVQEPAVCTAGQMLEFSLLLWSTNPLALEALGQPGAIEVGFYKSDMFALDVMTPRTSTRKNRYLDKLASGRMWCTDDGRPADGEPIPPIQMVTLPEPQASSSGSKALPAAVGSHRLKGAPSSRMKEVWAETYKDEKANFDSEKAGHVSNEAPDSDAQLGDVDSQNLSEESKQKDLVFDADSETLAGTERGPSPTPSLEDIDLGADGAPTDRFVRLDGEVRVPACSHPSFRYTHMGREYVVHLIITHPQYSHISPNATGLLAEFPVWYVLDRFGHLPPGAATSGAGMPQDLSTLPINGTQLPVGPDAVRAPVSIGAPTEEKRPTAKFTRYYAF
ncbi:hypothetical protein MVEN_00797300 [Mycena venus]|uniref:Uncharacterized protein n=1 Tax=Mycena venus TaxID=2733690 RepID=A0A8H7D6H4_9AGAR|nr:hypothetical protein MVEN_00797300 [Mycena venus]